MTNSSGITPHGHAVDLPGYYELGMDDEDIPADLRPWATPRTEDSGPFTQVLIVPAVLMGNGRPHHDYLVPVPLLSLETGNHNWRVVDGYVVADYEVHDVYGVLVPEDEDPQS